MGLLCCVGVHNNLVTYSSECDKFYNAGLYCLVLG